MYTWLSRHIGAYSSGQLKDPDVFTQEGLPAISACGFRGQHYNSLAKQRGLAAVFLRVELWDTSTDNSQVWEFSHGGHLLGNSVIQSLGSILIVCFI